MSAKYQNNKDDGVYSISPSKETRNKQTENKKTEQKYYKN